MSGLLDASFSARIPEEVAQRFLCERLAIAGCDELSFGLQY
jgi:hypothetical protein